jgi:hypothetical protein
VCLRETSAHTTRRNYAAHREQEIERVLSRQRARLAWLREFRRVPCLDCGGIFAPHIMQFDHRVPSEKSFSLTASRGLLKRRSVILEELAKCDIVCANCHRIRTAAQRERGEITGVGFVPPSFLKGGTDAKTRRERWRLRHDQQIELLDRIREMPCTDCSQRFPVCVMEFDHREIWDKVGNVSQLAGRVPIATLLEEISKCDIVCANCHSDRSYRRRSSAAGVAQWLMRLPSKQDKRVRFPSPAQLVDMLPRVFEESRSPYRVVA